MKYENIPNKAPYRRVILENGETVKGYKAMNKDWTCRDFQFETGKTYTQKGEIIPCENGFHFCKNVIDCFEFYDVKDSIIIEVEAYGEIIQACNKYCAQTIKIGNVLEIDEFEDLFVDAQANSGDRNSGSWNSGSWNSGNWNSGSWNSGNWNSGNRNSGDLNSGDLNSGDFNSGNWNSGNRNSGWKNSGNLNSGNHNSGGYNTGNWNSGNYNIRNRNSGNHNSGDSNSGNSNSGNHNSGYCNSGDSNSGDWNSGCNNSGDANSGNSNSGNHNIGYRNSGNRNSGDYNSGYGNISNYQSGIFCTEDNNILIFDKPSDFTMEDWLKSEMYIISCKAMDDGINSLDDNDWEILKKTPNWNRSKFIKCVKKARKEE